MGKTMGILMVLGLVLIGVNTVFATGRGHLQHSAKGSYSQQETSQVLALETVPASEVEYVDGPLAPLYDFLIQRRLNKFCKLLRDAGLEEVLQGLGGYWTMFVPTDASFILLPGGTLEDLKRNPQLLRDFILYHFVIGDFTTSQILNEMLVESVQGASLRFNVYPQILTVSGAQILEPDLEFELGRVHIIDHPLYPTPTTDTVSYLRTSHKQLYNLLLDANLVDYISSGTFTILAPDDDAFSLLSVELKEALASNRTLAERILLNHILPGSLYTAGVTDGMYWETMGETVLNFTTKRGLIFANGIPIVIPDVPLTNGVIHVLNRVLLPDGVENDCHCKPSTNNSPRQSVPQRPGGVRQTQRPQFVQSSTTRRPNVQSFQRQTTRPFGGQTPGTFSQNRPPIGPTTRPRLPVQPQRPFTPSRTGQTPRPFSPPVQITGPTFDQPAIQPQPEDDLNAVVGPGGEQKISDQTRTTRYPPPSRRLPIPQPPRVPIQPPRSQQPATIPDDGIYPEQDISPVVTNPPRQTSKWNNRQPTQPPRYPTPTRRPQTTRPYNRVTPPVIGKVPQRDPVLEQTFSTSSPQQEFQTQRPIVQTTSWQQRNQITRTTSQPTHQRTTTWPSRVPPQPQRRPIQPRPGSFLTPAPALPQESDQPFESNRQAPNCRRRSDRLTPSTQNLPVCPESETQEPCQSSPYNPSDPRPLCPNEIIKPGCRSSSEPFNPSDSRPPCPPSLPGQGCRVQGQQTYVGDRRPFCSPSPPIQIGCRDPSTPFNPTDNRPPCSTTRSINPVTPPQSIPQPQGCRRSGELQDGRPLCPGEVQEDCRPFQERPKAGDRRPICRTSHRQPPQTGQSHATKGQRPGNVPQPQQRPSYPQGNRSPNTQTTRRQPWQTTTQPPKDTTKEINNPGQQQIGKVPPETGRPLSPPVQIRPQPGSRQPQPGFVSQPQTETYPGQPQAGLPPRQSQTGLHPTQQQTTRSRPFSPVFGVSRPQPTPPQTVSRPTFVPQPSPPGPRSQSQGPYPQAGITQTPSFQPFHTTSHPTSQPNVPAGPSGIRPGSGQSHRIPISPPRQTTSSVTSFPGRVTSATRVPISVTGTSATPGEDTRRTLYEIVEDPALLIRGHPVKLTKIFALFHKAGIEDILSGPGPTTVFLPSDDAFAALPKGVVDQLEENPELLRQVLLYHVANVEILPSAQGESYTVPSLEGGQLVITMLNGGRLILISGAKAIAVTRANNGIFYVINQLLYPLPHPDIVGAIQSRPDLSTLAWLLPMSGLSNLLQGQTPYTFLAPTDNAFAQLPPAVYEELTQNTTALQEILLNHIIEGAHYGREFLTGGTFPSARGGKLKFQVVSYGYQVNEVNIKTPEIVTGTGVIHLIDQVLLEDADLKFFSKLDNSLTGQDVTIPNGQQSPEFQPFLQPPQQNGQRTSPVQPSTGGQRSPQEQPQPTGLQAPAGQWTGQRIPPGQRTPLTTQRPISGHSQGQRTPILSSGQTSIQPSHGGRRPPNGPSSFSGQRQPVLQPQTLPVAENSNGQQANVADLAKSMGLNRFANWITNTGLLEKVHDGGVYTVFAPTDDAVNSLPQEMAYSIDSDPAQTKSLLQYHIVPQMLNLNSLSNEETASTLLQGKTIRFNVYQSVQPNCKQLVTASGTPIGDSLATMGTVQMIPVTQVLYQPTGNLLNIIDASPILQSLSQAIKSARLTWVISGTGPLTFFAPGDTAFQSLSPEERKSRIDDKPAFTELLKRHLIRGTYFSSGVQEDLQKNNENNQPMTISLQEGILTVNSVPVAYSDITATNGVLHVIDQFL